jgi:Lectin C-type domain
MHAGVSSAVDLRVLSSVVMWTRCLSPIVLGGCAQLFGLDETSATSVDARIDARIDAAVDAPVDALACAGGDAHVVDPMSGACYTFFTTPMTRDAARTVCTGLGAGTALASVQTANENTLIAGLIGTNVAFLGGTDEIVEGQFRWPDGSLVVLTNWNTGEPNNGAGMFEEDCIVMLGSVAGKWDDRPCAPGPVGTGSYPFVCERD